MSNEKYNARCILLCKAFQAGKDVYKNLTNSLRNKFGESLKHYVSLGEYDGIYSFEFENDNLLSEISKHSKVFTENLFDSLFYRPLYLVFPIGSKNETNFLETESPFFFVSIIHTNHCSASFEYKETVRDMIIDAVDKGKMINQLNFKYRVYYSLDLSDYVILWKSSEPVHILKAMQYLHENLEVIGYTNTLCALSEYYLENPQKRDELGKEEFSITIQAVAKSYNEVCNIHRELVSSMKENHQVDDKPYFTFGNDDYLGFFSDMTPKTFYELHESILQNQGVSKAILSINTTLAIESYNKNTNNRELQISDKYKNIISESQKIKDEISKSCHELKDKYIEYFENNSNVVNFCHWRKSISELLVLLDNMSKSTVFDSVCFLFLDSANLFCEYLYYLKDISIDENELSHFLQINELSIETFVREWEQLVDHVVRIDGTFQKTPGYESLNHNISASLVEYHNAFTQKLISYFTLLDKNQNESLRMPRFASFVVPKACRRFKTAQWFYGNMGFDSLLFITIPTYQMYDSFFIITSLTHEVSHYCSNFVRNRDLRKKNIIKNIACLICGHLQIYSNKAIKECYDILNSLFDESFENDSIYYLVDIKSQLKKNVFCLLDTPKYLQKLLNAFYEDYQRDGCNDKTREAIAMTMRRESSYLLGWPSNVMVSSKYETVPLYSEIDDIASFYKEGYADLMMTYVLSLKPYEYIKAASLDMDKLNLPHDTGKLHQRYQRILIVCKAMLESGSWSNDLWIAGKEKLLECKNIKLNRIYKEFYFAYDAYENNDNELQKFYYSKDILSVIVKYLKQCLVNIKEKESDKNVIDEKLDIEKSFRDMISKGNNSMFSINYQNILQKNRENILEHWKNREKKPFIFGKNNTVEESL